jgi:hypothetical protein
MQASKRTVLCSVMKERVDESCHKCRTARVPCKLQQKPLIFSTKVGCDFYFYFFALRASESSSLVDGRKAACTALVKSARIGVRSIMGTADTELVVEARFLIKTKNKNKNKNKTKTKTKQNTTNTSQYICLNVCSNQTLRSRGRAKAACFSLTLIVQRAERYVFHTANGVFVERRRVG